jgi:hypothetical protein
MPCIGAPVGSTNPLSTLDTVPTLTKFVQSNAAFCAIVHSQACLGSWMRGLRRAYDPHLAARHWHQLFPRVWSGPGAVPLPTGRG